MVAERVVELLEAVEVDHRHRQRRVVAAAELRVEPLVEQRGGWRARSARRSAPARGSHAARCSRRRSAPSGRARRRAWRPRARSRRRRSRWKWSATSRPPATSASSDGRDERAPAVERDLARRLLRAPRGAGDQRTARASPSSGTPQRCDRSPSTPGRRRARVGGDAQRARPRASSSQTGLTRQPRSVTRDDDHDHQQHVAHRVRERDALSQPPPVAGWTVAPSSWVTIGRGAERADRRVEPQRGRRSAAGARGRTAARRRTTTGKKASRTTSAWLGKRVSPPGQASQIAPIASATSAAPSASHARAIVSPPQRAHQHRRGGGEDRQAGGEDKDHSSRNRRGPPRT